MYQIINIKSILCIAIFVGTLVSCSVEEPPRYNYVEKQFAFSFLRHGFEPNNKWIKKPENLGMLHETFKCFGYKNLITEEQWHNSPQYLDVSRPLNVLIDSLIKMHNFQVDTSNYYYKFWNRRRNEGNDEIVLSILQEVDTIMNEKRVIECRFDQVNDTLLNLLEIEQPTTFNVDIKIDDIEYLIEVGMHQSAYNLLTEQHFNLNSIRQDEKQELLQLLDTTDLYIYSWFEDNTK